MNKIVNVHEAKTHLSKILERVERGEEVVIARHGQPVARVSPIGDEARIPGRLAGRIRIGKDFEDPLPPEIAVPFGGGDE